MRHGQSWHVQIIHRPWQPKEDYTDPGVHQHNSIASRDELFQDSAVGIAPFWPRHAMPHLHVWHLLGGRGSAEGEFRCAVKVSGGYLLQYELRWDTADRHADHPKNCSSESCRMHTVLEESFLWQEGDLVYPTSNCACSSLCTFSTFPSLQGTPVQNWGGPEMGDVPKGTVYIGKYPCSIMFRRYVNDHQSNYHHQALNQVQSHALAWHLLIEMIRFWSCLVYALDVDHPCVGLLGNRVNWSKFGCRPKWMPSIPWFWGLSILFVHSGCCAICFPSHGYHFKQLLWSLCLCWIRGTCQIGLQGFYSFFVGSIFRLYSVGVHMIMFISNSLIW